MAKFTSEEQVRVHFLFNLPSGLATFHFVHVCLALDPDNAENVTETGVAEGWLEVRPGKIAE